jgi:hypothetical protein
LSLVTSAATRTSLAERGREIATLAAFQHGIAQIARRERALGQARDLAFLFFNNSI